MNEENKSYAVFTPHFIFSICNFRYKNYIMFPKTPTVNNTYLQCWNVIMKIFGHFRIYYIMFFIKLREELTAELFSMQYSATCKTTTKMTIKWQKNCRHPSPLFLSLSRSHLFSNSPYCLPYNSWHVSLKKWIIGSTNNPLTDILL